MKEPRWRSRAQPMQPVRACFFLFLWVATGSFALGCVEREQLVPSDTPVTERFDAATRGAKARNFVGHTLEVGGIVECSEGSFQEQQTEAYLRITKIGSEEALAVRKLSVEIIYDAGLFRNVNTRVFEGKGSYVEVAERLSSKLNGDDICSCVRVTGFGSIIGRNITVGTRICPEQKKPPEKPVVRVRPEKKKTSEPEKAL